MIYIIEITENKMSDSDEIGKQMDAIADEFNEQLRPIILRMEQKYKDNMIIYRLRQQLFYVLQNDIHAAIKNMGPFLWTSREEIINKNEQYFLNLNYLGAEITEKEFNSAERAAMNHFIGVVKKDFTKLSQADKDQTQIEFIDMLATYARYLKLDKLLAV